MRPAQNRSVSQALVVLLVITPLLTVWRAWRWTVEKAAPRLSVTVPPDDERMLPKG
jgi:membrane protein YdbS with pleckstrin-like domain